MIIIWSPKISGPLASITPGAKWYYHPPPPPPTFFGQNRASYMHCRNCVLIMQMSSKITLPPPPPPIERLHASFCLAAFLVHSLNRFSLCTKMAAVAVVKLLLCYDIICKPSIITELPMPPRGSPPPKPHAYARICKKHYRLNTLATQSYR